jgi:hypothetical protein
MWASSMPETSLYGLSPRVGVPVALTCASGYVAQPARGANTKRRASEPRRAATRRPERSTASTRPAEGSEISNSPPTTSTRQSAAGLGPRALWTGSPVAAAVATGNPGSGTGSSGAGLPGVPGTGTGTGTSGRGTAWRLPAAMKSRARP